MTIAAVTWDAVGTLVVPHPSVGAIYAELAQRHGISADAGELAARFPEAFRAVRDAWPVPYGRDEKDALRFWAQVIEGTFAESLPFELICDLFDAFARAARWRVLPGVAEALALIHARGLPQAVVSNYDGRLLRLIGELRLGPFVAVVTSASVGQAKPDPGPLFAAARQLQVPPQAILHIGDHPREDGEMCRASGARFLQVGPDGLSARELIQVLESA